MPYKSKALLQTTKKPPKKGEVEWRLNAWRITRPRVIVRHVAEPEV